MFGMILKAGSMQLCESEQIYDWLSRMNSRLKPDTILVLM
jgi:hypothetical protein